MLRFLRTLVPNLLLLLALLLVYAGIVFASVKWGAKPREHVRADITFVFDTTGSMQDEINGLLRTSSRFAGKLAEAGVDCQLSMVSFGGADEPQPIRGTFGPSADISAFQGFLRGIRAEGGGLEDQPRAARTAITNFTYRPNTHKIFILITDEHLFGDESYDPQGNPNDQAKQALTDWKEITQKLVDEKFTAYAICIPVEYYQQIATRTGGKFYDIGQGRDFSDIVMDIAEEINASLTR
ncbi:MAG: vWA domain-containing protein [Armatimonadota bacterium]